MNKIIVLSENNIGKMTTPEYQELVCRLCGKTSPSTRHGLCAECSSNHEHEWVSQITGDEEHIEACDCGIVRTLGLSKVQAVYNLLGDKGGSATWPEIYAEIETYYPDAKKSKFWQEGLRGIVYREIRYGRTFKFVEKGVIGQA